MLNLTRWTVPAALLLALSFGAPSIASAAGCTDGYAGCLNDNHAKRGGLRLMSDIECFAGWAGCVTRLVNAE